MSLERCAAHPSPHATSILLATADMIAVSREKVAALDGRLLANATQLSIFTPTYEDPV